ncbi:MAG: CdaR family protein [Candidatus Sulfobium sp.]|jgi:YbbR domain-containing protein
MRKLLFGNLSLKISALLLAVFLWLFVTSRGQSEISLEVPLEFKNVPAGYGIVTASTKEVNVTIRGQERIMKSLQPADVRVSVDLTRAKTGKATYYINKDDIRLPYAMSVMNVAPSSVKLDIEETVTKSVKVRPTVIGIPAKGYFIKSIDVQPRTVEVRGLESEVKKIRELRTDVVDISGLTTTTVKEVSLDGTNTNVKIEVSTIQVTIVIEEGKR